MSSSPARPAPRRTVPGSGGVTVPNRIALTPPGAKVRFLDDTELRTYVNHKLANSTAGFKVETSDDAHGAAEVLQDHVRCRSIGGSFT